MARLAIPAADRDLELQRQREQLQNASELLAADLRAQLQAAERSLREHHPPTALGNGAFFRIHAGRIVERGGATLPFYPAGERPVESHASVFAPAERIEFVDGRCDLALPSYRQFARAADDDLRAAALVRVARCFRKLHRRDEALEVYRELSTFGDTRIAGAPAELLARRQRIELFKNAGRDDAARAEEHLLHGLLIEGHYAIDRGTFEFFGEKLAIVQESIEGLSLALAAETSGAAVAS